MVWWFIPHFQIHLSNSACPNPKLQTPMIGLVILERVLEHISKGDTMEIDHQDLVSESL